MSAMCCSKDCYNVQHEGCEALTSIAMNNEKGIVIH
jgi:hypothetical protein